MSLKTMLMQNFEVTNKEYYGMFKRVCSFSPVCYGIFCSGQDTL